MKESHYRTPRSMSEAVFHYDADPIDAQTTRQAGAEWFAALAVCTLFVLGATLAVTAIFP